MGLFNLVRRRGFKFFMARLYGWGASVVILGALFKINHYPGADIMLIVGLGTESLIFFFSAFESPYVEPDWSLVYPELAGLYHSEKEAQEIQKGKPTQQLDNMLKEANIDTQLIERLGNGMRRFSDNASKLGEISDASVVTNEYVSNVKNASNAVGELSESYKKTSDLLNKDSMASTDYVENIKKASEGAASLSSAYSQASESIRKDMEAAGDFAGSIKEASESAKSLAEKYTKSADVLSKSAEALDLSSTEGKSYNEQLKRISDNLAALNAVYELQLQGTNQQVESAAKLQETMNQFLSDLSESSEKTSKYKEQLDLLTERVATLNKVYGNMLSAMSFKENQ